jgi:hypothetical protein
MTLAAILALLEAHGTVIFALWVAFEQYVASNKKLQSNSTLELVINTGKRFLGKYAKKS